MLAPPTRRVVSIGTKKLEGRMHLKAMVLVVAAVLGCGAAVAQQPAQRGAAAAGETDPTSISRTITLIQYVNSVAMCVKQRVHRMN